MVTRQERPVARGGQVSGTVRHSVNGLPWPALAVEIVNSQTGEIRRTATDVVGKFVFSALEPGTYRVSVVLNSQRVEFGQQSPGGAGRLIELGRDVAFDAADFSMPGPASLEGTVSDEFGDPCPNVSVEALRVDFVKGMTRFIPAGRSLGVTDDRGRFRVTELPQGTYYVVALPGAFTEIDLEKLHPTDDLSGLFEHLRSTDVPGFNITYFPGVSSPSTAEPIPVRLGEVANITFALSPSASATLNGTIHDLHGQAVSHASVVLVPLQGDDVRVPIFASTISRADGTFQMASVPFGSYLLQSSLSPDLFGSLRITVDSRTVSNAVVEINRGRSLTGEIRTEGVGALDMDSVTLRTEQIDFVAGPIMARVRDQATIDSLGRFELPNRRGLCVPVISAKPPWALKSVSVNGVDVTDRPIKCEAGMTDTIITLTDRTAELEGRVLRESAGAKDQVQVFDWDVIVFSVDPSRWSFPSRFVALTRPDQKGSFKIDVLLPGEYFAAAVEHVEGNEWRNPEFLRRLAPQAKSITLNPGTNVVNLMVR